MKIKLFLFILVASGVINTAWAEKVAIVYDESSPQASYAARKLSETLKSEGHELQKKHVGYDYLISLATHPERLKPEAFSIIPQGKIITVLGGDNRGMI